MMDEPARAGGLSVVAAEALLGWSVDPDGCGVRLGLLTEAGNEVTLCLPAQGVPQAVMALLALLTELQRRGAAKIVHPIANWHLEGLRASDQRLLTLTTTEGFRLAFMLGQDDIDAIALAAVSLVPTKQEVAH